MDESAPDGAATGSALEVTRHAEQLRVSTMQRPIARAVLRKRVVTTLQTVTVEVRHEEADLELLPPEPGDAEPSTRGAHAALPEMVLWEERIEIVRRLVPVERVRLEIDQVTTTRLVTDTVRHEAIDLTHDVATDPADA